MHSENDRRDAVALLAMLRGRKLASVQYEKAWRFNFGVGQFNEVWTWRIISDGHIAFASSDHEQQFGLPAPLDGMKEVAKFLKDAYVRDVHIVPICSDVVVEFDGDRKLEILNLSSGWEGWNFTDAIKMRIVAQGGGNLVIW